MSTFRQAQCDNFRKPSRFFRLETPNLKLHSSLLTLHYISFIQFKS